MIVKATIEHLDDIMKCINDAKRFLKNSGSTQWNGSDGYPSRETLLNDIKLERAYVCIRSNILCGVCVYSGLEKEYEKPFGKWLTDCDKYTTVHRVAVRDEARGMGVAHELIRGSIDYARSIGNISVRIDTHPKNLIMQHIIPSLGFTNCGYVIYSYIEKEPKRLIYEILVDEADV